MEVAVDWIVLSQLKIHEYICNLKKCEENNY